MSTQFFLLRFACFFIFLSQSLFALPYDYPNLVWSKDSGYIYYLKNQQRIIKKNIITQEESVIFSTDSGYSYTNFDTATLKIKAIESFSLSPSEKKIMLFFSAVKVWRYKTKGQYAVFDVGGQSVYWLGKTLPQQSLMFAKLSPNEESVGYVSEYNLYVENLKLKTIKALTQQGTQNNIFGTFDWAYEEELKCRDGFRWSYDSKHIAFWNIDASKIPNFTMLNNTDSVYPKSIVFPYPKVGYDIPKTKLGVVNVEEGKLSWINLGIQLDEYFVPRMEWFPKEKKIIFQYLNRKQTKSKIYVYTLKTQKTDLVSSEEDSVWIDIKASWNDKAEGWEWLNNKGDFLWFSEKDDYRKMYVIDGQTFKETTLDIGNMDVIDLLQIDTLNQAIYFLASPDNATQKYVYKKNYGTNATKPAERLTPQKLAGSNDYDIAPYGAFARHQFSNYYTPQYTHFITLPNHQALDSDSILDNHLKLYAASPLKNKIQYITIPYASQKTYLDAWVVYPNQFDPSKKYPVLFYVYGEPASQTVMDAYHYQRSLIDTTIQLHQDFIYVSVDNRGTPAPKGRAWRKAIYNKVGLVNIEDQVYAAQFIGHWSFVDSSKMAVWGWSGGGTSSLHLKLRYPQIYKTAIAIAPVTNRLLYDNIYEERYMGLVQDSTNNYRICSPIHYAHLLEGHLMMIHGSGDDNVHYQNFELMMNEFIKHNKIVHTMVYPNRSHGIYEGAGTRNHLKKTFTTFLNTYFLK